MNTTLEQRVISCTGPEGSGKTTLCNSLAPMIGARALFVPEWPVFRSFMEDPSTYAYQNQHEALKQTVGSLQALRRQHSGPILTDTCPDRVHLVHSWKLLQEGHISGEEMSALDKQYQAARRVWGADYICFSADMATLRSRIVERDRPEDEAYNLQQLGGRIDRWNDIHTDPSWRLGKNILELVASAPQNEIVASSYEWLTKTQ